LCTTAITAIVATAFVVVIVVANAVALVLRRPAGRLAALVLWVDALTLQTKHPSKTNGYAQALVE
jgi:hypothetical protein